MIIEIKENQPRILISRTGIQEYIFSTMSWRTIAPIGTGNSYFTCIQIPETTGKILAVGDQYSTYRIPVIFDVTNNRSVPANHQVFQRFAPTLVKTIIFKSNVFLPVEHTSYNRVFKISSTFLIPPPSTPTPKTFPFALILWRLGYHLWTLNTLSQVTGYPNYRVSIHEKPAM